MTKLRIDKLRRLVRATEAVYRVQAAQVAQLNHERLGIAESEKEVSEWLDNTVDDRAFLNQLAIARVTQLRRQLSEAEARLEAELDAASAALAGFKGAEGILIYEQARTDRKATDAELVEVIDNTVRRLQTSLE
ncbi:MAG: hypothetical protein AB7O43_04375 [Hyphomicrobiaceae bacterium]